MKDDQKDQNSVNESQEHRASVSVERAAEAADSQSGQPMKIERLVLSIAANQFTVPLPTGKEVVRAVNAHDALVAAAKAALEYVDNMNEDTPVDPNCKECVGRVFFAKGTPEPPLCWIHQLEKAVDK